MNNGGAFRKKKVYFTQVSNHILRNPEVSLKAKGLYSLIQSYITIENFTLYKTFLIKQCREGERAFESTWKELKENGYLIQYKFKDKKTGMFYYEYDLVDEPQLNIDNGEGNQYIDETIKPKEPDMQNVGMACLNPYVQNVGVENAGGGDRTSAKEGVYNNTNSNNTYLNNTDRKKIEEETEPPITPTQSIQEKFYDLMSQDISEVSLNTWIKPLNIHTDVNIVTIETQNNFTYKIIKERYLDIIEKNFKHIGIENVILKVKE